MAGLCAMCAIVWCLGHESKIRFQFGSWENSVKPYTSNGQSANVFWWLILAWEVRGAAKYMFVWPCPLLKIKDIFFLSFSVQGLTSITHLSKICLFQSTTESDTHSRLTGVSEGQENLKNMKKNQIVVDHWIEVFFKEFLEFLDFILLRQDSFVDNHLNFFKKFRFFDAPAITERVVFLF